MLHTHSNYSLLQGAVSIDDLIGRAKSFGMKALALTDRNGMYGLIQFYKKATEEDKANSWRAYIDDPAGYSKEYVLLLRSNEGRLLKSLQDNYRQEIEGEFYT
ncbi:MAG: PHP domain-containing protein [Ignavibacteriales bacterium]|nr:PHP domain-containing protein [Ignavibacteriales bacterium]